MFPYLHYFFKNISGKTGIYDNINNLLFKLKKEIYIYEGKKCIKFMPQCNRNIVESSVKQPEPYK